MEARQEYKRFPAPVGPPAEGIRGRLSRTGRRLALPLALLATASLASGTVPALARNCADTVAAAFVYHDQPDLPATLHSLQRGKWALVKHRQLGSGAWACLGPDKQQDLSIRAIPDDRGLARTIESNVPSYTQVDRLGTLPQERGDGLYVYRLVGPIIDHDLVSGDGPLDWIRVHVLAQKLPPQLRQVTRSRSILFLVHLDKNGKVDRFGFEGKPD